VDQLRDNDRPCFLAEYPGALFLAAASSAYRRGPAKRPVSKIICHITDGHGRAINTAAMFATPGCRTSAHFVIGQDGQIIQCVRLDDIAYHAHLANGTSVGIEHCARSPRELSPSDPGMSLTPVQIERSVELVAWLCARYGLPVDREHVQGHAEADPNTDHKDCPAGVADGWPWERWVGAPVCRP
jgi:N-acetyl-anhydromuramyl-L-alanine amidase AmpD